MLNGAPSRLTLAGILSLVGTAGLRAVDQYRGADLLANISFFVLAVAAIVTFIRLARATGSPPLPAPSVVLTYRGRPFLRDRIDYVIPMLVAAASAQTWFRSDRLLAFGDLYPVPHLSPDNILMKSVSLWNSFSDGLGGRAFTITQTPAAVFSKSVQWLGFSEATAQRIFITTLFVLQAAAIVYLLRVLWPQARSASRMAGALFYLFNFLTVITLPAPVAIVSFALIPLLVGLFVKGCSEGRRSMSSLWAIATLPLAYVASNPSLAAVTLLGSCAMGLLLHLGRGGGMRSIASFSVRALPLSLLVNVWWIVPLLLAVKSSAGTSIPLTPDDWGWTHARNSFANLFTLNTTWAWPQRMYFPYASFYSHPVIAALVFVPAMLAFSSMMFVTRRRQRTVPLLTGFTLVLLFVGKGVHEPLGTTGEWLLTSVPGLWILREPASKLLPLVACCFSILITFSVEMSARRIQAAARSRWSMSARRVLPLGPLLLPLLAAPILTGSIVADERPVLPETHVSLPTYWSHAAEHLNSMSEQQGRILLLPSAPYYQMPYEWGFYGADILASELFTRPVVTGTSITYIPSSRAVEDAVSQMTRWIAAGDDDRIRAGLDSLGIRFVLVREDIDHKLAARLGNETIPPSKYTRVLERSDAFEEAGDFGKLTLYEASQWDPRPIRVASSFSLSTQEDVSSVGSSSASAITIGSGDASDISRLVGALPDGDVWSASVAPGRDVDVELPTHARRSATTPLYRIQRVDQGGSPQLDAGAYVAGAGTRLVRASEDRSGDLNVPVPFERAATLRLLTGSSARDDGDHDYATTWGEVGDCNRYDNRSKRAVGIEGSVSSFGGRTSVVRLEANDHRACVSRVLAVAPSRSYELSFDHRALRGRGSGFCVLLTSATQESCIDLPLLKPSDTWSTYTSTFTVPANSSQVELFLYGSADGTGKTISLYDEVSITPLTPAASWEIEWAPPLENDSSDDLVRAVRQAEELVSQERNLVRRSGFGQVARSDPWSPIGDCDRSDARSLQEVGIAGDIVEDDGDSVLRLRAEAHAACTSQRVDVDDGRSYEVTVSHKTLEGNPAEICVYAEIVGRCLNDPVLDADTTWQTDHTLIDVPRGVESVRVFLYARSTGDRTTVTLYDDVEITAAQDNAFLLDYEPPVSEPDAQVSPAGENRYRVEVTPTASPIAISLNQSFDEGWRIVAPSGDTVEALHLVGNGYGNAWVLPDGYAGTLFIEFAPERMAEFALRTSAGSTALLLLPIISAGRRAARKRVQKRRLDSARSGDLPN